MPGCAGAGCDHADTLIAASSVTAMPNITHRTRRAADAVAAIATALLISCSFARLPGNGNDGGGAS